jgi:SRSO17 transposase
MSRCERISPGLYLPGERKSVEPLAARVDPRRVPARHQSLHHFVADAAWEDAAVLRVAASRSAWAAPSRVLRLACRL